MQNRWYFWGSHPSKRVSNFLIAEAEEQTSIGFLSVSKLSYILQDSRRAPTLYGQSRQYLDSGVGVGWSTYCPSLEIWGMRG